MKEAEEAERVALFRSMPALFAALAAWTWRADKRAAARETIALRHRATRCTLRGAMIAAAKGRTLTEREAKAVLALYGVPVVGERLTQSADEAVAAADALGYPVVLKVESPDLPHKTEAGVIRLNLRNADDVRAGYRRGDGATRTRVSPPPHINGVLVQPMVPQGVEMVVGARIDPLFGPLVRGRSRRHPGGGVAGHRARARAGDARRCAGAAGDSSRAKSCCTDSAARRRSISTSWPT